MSTKSGSSEDDLANWEMVSGDLQADEDGFESDSSIEVVSMEMDELESSSPCVSLPSSSPRGPVFVLRVPSRERDDLTTESEESDEGDTNISSGLRMVCHREGCDSPVPSDISQEARSSCTPDRTDNIESGSRGSAVVVAPEVCVDDGETHGTSASVSSQGEEKNFQKNMLQSADKDMHDETPVSVELTTPSGQFNISEEHVETSSLLEENTVASTGHIGWDTCPSVVKRLEITLPQEGVEDGVQCEEELMKMADEMVTVHGERPPDSDIPEPDVLEPDIPEPELSLENKEKEAEIMPKVGSGEIEVDRKINLDILDMQAENLHVDPVIEDAEILGNIDVMLQEPQANELPGYHDNRELPNIVELEDAVQLEDVEEAEIQGPLAIQLDEFIEQPPAQFVEEDDTETESTNEMEAEDDRIESDQSDLHTPDNSNLSNVDIGDLILDNHQVLRGYVHQPNGQLNLTLNYIVCLVLVVVVGMGIGHSIGSSLRYPEQIASQQERMSELYKLRQQIDQLEASFAAAMEQKETLQLENEDIRYAYQTMREKANLLQNEITELRSEVTKLKYKGLTQSKTDKLVAVHFERKKMQLMNVINSLQQERADLIKAVATTRYGQPPGNNEDEGKSDVKKIGSVFGKPGVIQVERGITPDNYLKKVVSNGAAKDFGDDSIIVEGDNSIHEVEQLTVDADDRKDDELNEREIQKLSEELNWISARAEMWEKLYLKERNKNSEGSCPPKGKVVIEDVFRCFGRLVQNYANSENFSKILQQNWEEWMNQSASSFNIMRNVLSKFTFRNGQESKSEETEKRDQKQRGKPTDHKSGKRHKDQWRDTMQDLFNKTKASVSDVSKQIQDTWKQVKNLSTDFWKKHEPVVSTMKDRMSNKVENMAQHLKNWIYKSRRSKKHRPYHQYYKKDDYKEEEDGGKKKQKEPRGQRHSSQFGSTKRRHYKSKVGDTEHGRPGKNDGGNNMPMGKGARNFRKLQDKFKRLNAKIFLRMNCFDVQDIYQRLERVGRSACVECLDSHVRQWYTCQRMWWFNSVYDIKSIDNACQTVLADWQIRVGSGQKGCIFNNEHCKRSHGRKRRCKRSHFQFKNKDYLQENANDKWKQDNSNKHWNSREEWLHDDVQGGTWGYYRDSEFQFDDASLQEMFNDTWSEKFSDPWFGNLSPKFEEDSWYLKQMKYRQMEREKKEFEDNQRKNPKWMFDRAEDREYQRTLPDDWYSRRSNRDVYD